MFSVFSSFHISLSARSSELSVRYLYIRIRVYSYLVNLLMVLHLLFKLTLYVRLEETEYWIYLYRVNAILRLVLGPCNT